VRVSQSECEIINKGNRDLELTIFDKPIHVQSGKTHIAQTAKKPIL
jgi:hypothetical protein